MAVMPEAAGDPGQHREQRGRRAPISMNASAVVGARGGQHAPRRRSRLQQAAQLLEPVGRADRDHDVAGLEARRRVPGPGSVRAVADDGDDRRARPRAELRRRRSSCRRCREPAWTVEPVDGQPLELLLHGRRPPRSPGWRRAARRASGCRRGSRCSDRGARVGVGPVVDGDLPPAAACVSSTPTRSPASVVNSWRTPTPGSCVSVTSAIAHLRRPNDTGAWRGAWSATIGPCSTSAWQSAGPGWPGGTGSPTRPGPTTTPSPSPVPWSCSTPPIRPPWCFRRWRGCSGPTRRSSPGPSTRSGPSSGCWPCGGPCSRCRWTTPRSSMRRRRERSPPIRGSASSPCSTVLACPGIRPDGCGPVSRQVLRLLGEHGEMSAAELSALSPVLGRQIVIGEGTSHPGKLGVGSRVLLLLAAEGKVVRSRTTGAWTSTRHRWDLLERWLGGPLIELPAAEARAALAARWLARFGPATMADLKWWTGLDDGRHPDGGRVARHRAGRPRRHGGARPAGDTEPTPETEPWVALLPSLDPTAMGWQERDWYLGDHKLQVFDRNGNAGRDRVGGRAHRRRVGPTGERRGRVAAARAARAGADAHAVADAAGRLEVRAGRGQGRPALPRPARPGAPGMTDATRVDRWVWAIRLYKTRGDATDACRGGHVSINGSTAKPAATVRPGDRVEARGTAPAASWRWWSRSTSASGGRRRDVLRRPHASPTRRRSHAGGEPRARGRATDQARAPADRSLAWRVTRCSRVAAPRAPVPHLGRPARAPAGVSPRRWRWWAGPTSASRR